MDMNNAFDEILKIQDKLDKTNTVNPKITVAGKECTLYHTGNKPSANDVGANTTIFAGIISASAISEALINMNTCVNSSGIITLSTNVVYRVSGAVHNKKNLYLYNKSNTSQKYTLLDMSGITLGSNDYIPYNRTFKINTASTWFLADENQARPDWTQVTIEKISGGN